MFVYDVYKLVYETCLQRHRLIVNDKNHQKASAISVSRIRMHLKKILNYRSIIPNTPPPPFSQSILKLLGES